MTHDTAIITVVTLFVVRKLLFVVAIVFVSLCVFLRDRPGLPCVTISSFTLRLISRCYTFQSSKFCT